MGSDTKYFNGSKTISLPIKLRIMSFWKTIYQNKPPQQLMTNEQYNNLFSLLEFYSGLFLKDAWIWNELFYLKYLHFLFCFY